jgi:hypothetical protein
MDNRWLFRDDVYVAGKFDRLLLRDAKLGVQISNDIRIAAFDLQEKTNSLVSGDVPLPENFPAPKLALPNKGFSPDYFTFGGLRFCSARLRCALGQPENTVQFAPVELITGGEQARGQDYRLMRVLARQKAMDVDRSDCTREERVNRITGQVETRPIFINRLVLLEGLKPATEIFRIHESTTDILVTDMLAERVLRAGCTGMEFVDPETEQFGSRMQRYRTKDGIGERPVHMP